MHRRLFRIFIFLALTILFGGNLYAQTACNTPGQNPETAFPVCGTSSFSQASVNLCGGKKVPNPKCPNSPLTDINPYWYRFTCFETGTLGFTITPNANNSDYDWQVFDITNVAPGDVYTNASLTVACNWSQYFGNTGTTSTAANLMECEGAVPQYSKMPTLTKGHTYLLLVSHFTNTQAGYKLSFGGGTAVITDTTASKPLSAKAFCDGSTIALKLNKRMLCSSLAANGSDFTLQGGAANTTSARGIGCTQGFDFDSLVLTLNTGLPTGNYQLLTSNGSDGNTLLDICGTAMQTNLGVSVQVIAPKPSLMSLSDTIACAPATIRLRFDEPIVCSTLATNGTDFTISGPQTGVSVTGISTTCSNDTTGFVTLQLSQPLTVGGNYTINHVPGTDGNTSLNICGLASLPQSVSFAVAEKVSATFTIEVLSNCNVDSVKLSHNGSPGATYRYTWFDGATVNANKTMRLFTDPGSYQVGFVIDNGICRDSASASVDLLNTRVKAAFGSPGYACPGDTVMVTDSSTGPVVDWRWDFGDGISRFGQHPSTHQYWQTAQLTRYTIRLTVSSADGCTNTATHVIEVPPSCYIAVPGAFTPNGDGLNDQLYPINAYKAENLKFRVYNRYGQLVWETADWTRKWDGSINGVPQPAGTYVWHLHYELSGRTVDQKGTVILIR